MLEDVTKPFIVFQFRRNNRQEQLTINDLRFEKQSSQP